ncbi:MAG: glycosyltransferase family 2 protein [Leptospiraceae bacterium]|nr:glycosyltransferase family 2 protein [Leptospiraceae bacterium]
MNNIAIIIPAFNEDLTIRETILDFYKLDKNFQIVVIDNNSNDNTFNVTKETFSEFRIKGNILSENRQGKANAVRLAFQNIDADLYVLVDADTTYKAKDLDKMLEIATNSKVDMVVGDRHLSGAYQKENKRYFHNFGNILVKVIINVLFNTDLNDIMSGYRVMTKRFVKNFPILSKGFELETEITLHALDKRFQIVEHGINYVDRPEGSFSKLNTFIDGFKVLRTIIWIFKYYKPFHFFGFISFVLFLLSIFSAYPVINDYIKAKYVYHIPLAILSTGLMITSILSLAIGLILDSISRFHRFDFEQKLLNFKNK